MNNPKPFEYDGVYTRGPSGNLVQVYEPRWFELGRILKMSTLPIVKVKFVQCGREVECRAKEILPSMNE